MPDLSRVAGIVLAGGKSSRMGRNKALLDFRGRPLVQHMMNILRDLGLQDIYISGSIANYPCIDDNRPFAGPAQGICNVWQKKPDYEGYLFVPVDMPLLTADILRLLLAHKEGSYFAGRPLPVFFTCPVILGNAASVQGLIAENSLYVVDLPPLYDPMMANLNTPQEWQEVLYAS
ncbi:MAG TPA: molybdenum cofactor guanylyltransferase [Rhodospirillaceae bacterium]|nr:molybdenum cofactor guanylyltransferase [Rhodospirillaceae bacterium]